jgi:hypothetical protein
MIIVVDWSWVASEDLVAERREHARKLAGSRLSSVSYVLMDYGQPDRVGSSSGPRLVADVVELASPTWKSGTFD